MPANLDIDLLRCFVSVVDTGALSRAAERIGRTQGAVSMQMRRLEDVVGRPLLNRTGRGVVATIHGERLLGHARRILSSHDDALAELSGKSLVGTLRFGCPEDYANLFLPTILHDFAQLHPHAKIEVVCASSPRLLGQLDRNGLDLALVSTLNESASGVLRVEDLVWVGQKNISGGMPIPLRLALGGSDALDYSSAVAALEGAKRAYEISYSSDSLAGLLAIVRSGQAIAVLTRAAVPPDLRVLTVSGLPCLPKIGRVLQMDEKRASPLTRAFEEHVRICLPRL